MQTPLEVMENVNEEMVWKIATTLTILISKEHIRVVLSIPGC